MTESGESAAPSASAVTPHAASQEDAASADTGGKKRLTDMLMPELRSLAASLGVKSTGLKKADLVSAIRSVQAGGKQGASGSAAAKAPEKAPERAPAKAPELTQHSGAEIAPTRERGGRGREAQAQTPAASAPESAADSASSGSPETRETRDQSSGRKKQRQRNQQDKAQDRASEKSQDKPQQGQQDQQGKRAKQDQSKQDAQGQRQNQQSQNQQNLGQQDQDDDEAGGRRNRRRRGRERNQGRGRGEPDLQIYDDDVLSPCAGILDVLENYAFVRTTGYLPGAEDVYVSLSVVRKYGLRRGDAIVGQVRHPREGERKEKFNPLVRIDSINGEDPEGSEQRVEFGELTALYPNERLRLETGASDLTGRVIDAVAPIGKGQRGLIVSPANAGKTMVLQSIANSISVNNPECHLMVVLVDERPEEITDFERTIKGEVISSTFDRPPGDHTIVAELAIERAKRLVEMGHDVVVLLDGITRLTRAYNLASPASGRSLPGGVDAAALYPPKKFFGSARNIEDGGSLTILATAVVEGSSEVDAVIFEEFKDTSNMELRLRRDFAEKRFFPAVDVVASGTRREDSLLSKEEAAVTENLRRQLADLDEVRALETLLDRLRATQSNYELLRRVQQESSNQV